MQERSDVPYGYASMLLLGEGSEATEPYNKYDKIRPHSIRSLQFDQKVRPLSFRPEKFDLFTATRAMCMVMEKICVAKIFWNELQQRWFKSVTCKGASHVRINSFLQ